jgi:hypothetical protein
MIHAEDTVHRFYCLCSGVFHAHIPWCLQSESVSCPSYAATDSSHDLTIHPCNLLWQRRSSVRLSTSSSRLDTESRLASSTGKDSFLDIDESGTVDDADYDDMYEEVRSGPAVRSHHNVRSPARPPSGALRKGY